MSDTADEVAHALAPLVGLVLRGAERSADSLRLRLGAADGADTYELLVACPWRLVEGDRLLVGSGDLLTPADPEAELETFDWDVPGASWLDVRLGELAAARGAAPPAVAAAAADALGGLRLTFSGGAVLEAFPNSTPTGHVSTEFWRLVPPDAAAPHLAVGTFGVLREPGA